MKQVLEDPKDQGFATQDWLNLHGLEPRALTRLLTAYERKARPRDAGKPDSLQSINAKDAWGLAAEALVKHLPALEGQILYVRDFCEVDFEAAENDKPYTLDRGAGVMPLVSICYRNAAADVLCVAHEFGHALQYHLVQGRFVPPVIREIAAFTAEKALIDYMRRADMAALGALEEAWWHDSSIYLENDLHALTEALRAPETEPYGYRQNYPLARLYVEASGYKSEAAQECSIFEGYVDLTECLPRLQDFVMSQPRENYLPELPESDPDRPSLSAYAALGAMALLDMAQPESDADQPVEDYYETRQKHLRNGTAFIDADEENKPYGYALWDVVPDDGQSLNTTYSTAPFGETKSLLKQLRLRHSNEVIE
jgi:hypothetical protein